MVGGGPAAGGHPRARSAAKPVELPDGDVLAGSSTENAGWVVHLERWTPGDPASARTWRRTGPLNDPRVFDAIQPTILAHSKTRLQILCRSRQGVVTEAWSEDGGLTWGPMTATALPNPSAGIDSLRLADGRFLLVYNPTRSGRHRLEVAVSEDGEAWRRGAVLEDAPGEYSYPAVIQSRDGLVHVTYTWKRERIRHVVLDPARLTVRGPLFEALVWGTIGAAAAGSPGWSPAGAGPRGTRRHRATVFLSFVVLFTLGSATLMPHARAWKQERDAESLLRTEPLFEAVLEDDPSLREPLRGALLAALRGGQKSEARLAGQRLLSPRLWRYVPRASDAAAVRLGRALVATLRDLQRRDPEQCYRFLFPTVAGPPRSGSSAREDQILGALRAVVASARDGSAEPLDRRAAAKQLDAVFGRLRERLRGGGRRARSPPRPRGRTGPSSAR